MTTIARLMVELGMDASGFDRAVAQAESSFSRLGANLRSAGLRLSAGVTAPISAIGTVGLAAAGDFERAMNQMAVISGATAQEMAALQAEALHLGAVTTFSANEAAGAMLELAKAGLSPGETLGAVSGVLDLAAAGGLALADAAEVAANAVNAFNLPAEQTTDVANLLAAAANSSSVNVSDLAIAMRMSSAVFAANGQSLTDLTTSLALMGNNALKGSDAGTALKTMLMRLTAPTDKAAGVLSDLGVSVFEADGSMRAFRDILVDLERGTANLTDEQRSAALATVFGADAIRAATILLKEGTSGFDAMSDAVNKQGAAAAVAEARMSGLAGALLYFRGTVESTLIAAFLPFTDGLSAFIRRTADFISTFTKLPQPVQRTVIVVAALAAALGPLLLGLGALAAAAGMAMPVLAAVGSAVAALAAPLALVAAAVAALGVAFAADFGGIRTALGRAASSALGFGRAVLEAAQGGAALDAWLARVPARLRPAARGLAETVRAVQRLWAVLAAGGVASDALSDASAQVTTALHRMATGVLSAVDGAAVSQMAHGLAQRMVLAFNRFDLGAIGAALNGLRDRVLGAVTGAIRGVSWAGVGDAFAGLVDGAAARLRALDWNRVDWAAVFGGLVSLLVPGLGRALALARWVVSSDQVGGLVDAVRRALVSVDWGGIAGALGGLARAAGDALRRLDLRAAAADLWRSVTALFDGWVLPVPGFADLELPQPFTDSLARLGDTVRSFVDLGDSFAPLAASVGALGDALGELNQALADAGVYGAAVLGWLEALNAALAALRGALALGLGQATALFSMLAGVVKGAAETVRGLATGDAAMWQAGLTRMGGALTQFFATSAQNALAFVDRLVAAMGGMAVNLARALGFTEAAAGLDALLARVRALFAALRGGGLGALGDVVSGALRQAVASVTALNWADFIAPLADWGVYVAQLAWDGFITVLGDWSQWVSSLDWGGFVNGLADWGQWVVALAWETFVTALADWGQWVSSLDWGGFVNGLADWGQWVAALAWETFVTALGDWGQWVSSLDWGGFVTTLVDWATWIPALGWNAFVAILDWATIVAYLFWTEFVPLLTWQNFVTTLTGWGQWIAALDWGGYIAALTDWGQWITSLDWGGYVTALTDWAQWIAALAWESFVSKLQWPIIARLDWGQFVTALAWPALPALRWQDFVPRFSWPSLPSFAWGAWIAAFRWPALPSFRWQDFVPRFSWPSLPSIDWGDFIQGVNLASLIPSFNWGDFFGGSAGENARGTSFWRGGLTWVGEEGAELVSLPRGARIYPAAVSAQMAADAAQPVQVTIHANVASDIDLHALAYQVASEIGRWGR